MKMNFDQCKRFLAEAKQALKTQKEVNLILSAQNTRLSDLCENLEKATQEWKEAFFSEQKHKKLFYEKFVKAEELICEIEDMTKKYVAQVFPATGIHQIYLSIEKYRDLLPGGDRMGRSTVHENTVENSRSTSHDGKPPGGEILKETK